MNSNPGLLIAVEGVDGAGKHTQVEALRRELHRLGHKTSAYSFPDYAGSHLGGAVKRMLSGEYGNASQIHPMLSAPLFALERFEKRNLILRDLGDGCIVLCDRYVYSNVAHQASRLPVNRRSDFRSWVERIEFELLNLPRPGLTILLDVDDETGRLRRQARARQSELNRPLDDYERDEGGLSLARSIYLELARDLDWLVVAAAAGGDALDREAVTQNLLNNILHYVAASK